MGEQFHCKLENWMRKYIAGLKVARVKIPGLKISRVKIPGEKIAGVKIARF